MVGWGAEGRAAALFRLFPVDERMNARLEQAIARAIAPRAALLPQHKRAAISFRNLLTYDPRPSCSGCS